MTKTETNEEKYKTPEERAKAFRDFCESYNGDCDKCPARKLTCDYDCLLCWLALEAEEENTENCPFCGSSCTVVRRYEGIVVACSECDYQFGNSLDRDATIAAHNRVARAVKDAKESEVSE